MISHDIGNVFNSFNRNLQFDIVSYQCTAFLYWIFFKVEVEYLPCLIPQSCWGVMHEFMQGFLGSVINKQMPSYLDMKANEIYSPNDTINQYLEQFAYFRKLNA